MALPPVPIPASHEPSRWRTGSPSTKRRVEAKFRRRPLCRGMEHLEARAMLAISIPSHGTALTQDFNTLAMSGTSSATPTDWVFSETGSSANSTYTAENGSEAAGDTYSFGAGAASGERALGGVGSGTLTSTIGASFINNTGGPIASLVISYNGEQWRLGQVGRTDRLDFQYSLNATSLTTGTWVDVNSLDFTSPSTTTAGAIDGNAVGRSAVLSTISPLSIANLSTFWIRWNNDFDAAGNEDGLAIDDFSLTSSATPNTSPTISDVANQSTRSYDPKSVTYTIGDAQTPVGSLLLAGTSSDPMLVPNANIVVTGTGAARTVTLTPIRATGTATITMTVTDGGGMTAVDSFVLTVTQAPTLDIGNICGNPGDVIQIPIRLNTNGNLVPGEPIEGIDLAILYDTNVLTLRPTSPPGPPPGPASLGPDLIARGGWSAFGNSDVFGKLSVSLSTFNPILDSFDGIICYIRATIRLTAPAGPSPINLVKTTTISGNTVTTFINEDNAALYPSLLLGPNPTSASNDPISDGIVTVLGGNQPPVNTFPVGPIAGTEDTNVAFTAGNTLSVADADSASVITSVSVPSSVVGTFTATSGGGSVTPAFSNGNATVTFTGAPAQVNLALATLAFVPAANRNTTDGTTTVTINTTDGTTQDNDTFNVTLTAVNDVPSFVRGSDQTLAFNPGPQSVTGWATALATGPPNESAQSLAFQVTGNSNPGLFSSLPAIASNGTLTYTPAATAIGSATITIVAQDNGGVLNGGVDTSSPQSFNITISPPSTLRVLSATPTATGAVINFSHDLDASPLNLYDLEGSPFGAADVTLVGATLGNVSGSAVIDANLRRLTFVRTSGVLLPDTYTLTVRSGPNGFQSAGVGLLDGDGNGTPGDSHVQTFVINSPPANAVTLSLPNFARGPQQPVNVPANNVSGIPLSFSNGNGVTSATLQILYNPALLSFSAVTVPAGIPPGATSSLDTSTPGVALIQFNSPTPLAAGSVTFANLQANVPTTAPYRSKHVLDITNVVLNGGSIPALADDGLHVAAYFGDVTGNGTYSAQDASKISRLAVGLDTGLQLFKLLDPVVIADITGNGAFSALDTSRMLQASVGLPAAEIPSLPSPAVSLIQGGPDPKLSIPTDLVATAGGSLQIPVMIDSIVNLTGNGLESADLVIYYDAAALDVSQVGLGSLLAGRPWSAASRIDAMAGRIFVSLAGTTPLEGFFHGELVQLQATVNAAARPGSVAINLASDSRDPSRFTQLNEGFLTLIPAPTNSASDQGVDGLVTIVPAPSNPVPVSSLQRPVPAVRIDDQRLTVVGTQSNDRIVVGSRGNEVIVRVNQSLLGHYLQPAQLAIDGGGGEDTLVIRGPWSIQAQPTAATQLLLSASSGTTIIRYLSDQESSIAVPAAEPPSFEASPAAFDLVLLQVVSEFDRLEATARPLSRSIKRR